MNGTCQRCTRETLGHPYCVSCHRIKTPCHWKHECYDTFCRFNHAILATTDIYLFPHRDEGCNRCGRPTEDTKPFCPACACLKPCRDGFLCERRNCPYDHLCIVVAHEYEEPEDVDDEEDDGPEDDDDGTDDEEEEEDEDSDAEDVDDDSEHSDEEEEDDEDGDL